MNNSLLKNSFFYLIGTIMVAIGGFVISLLYSYFFDTTSYGNYCLIFSIYSLVSNFIAGWISTSMIRNYQKYKKDNREYSMLSSIFKYLLNVSILTITIISVSLLFIKIDISLKIVILLLSIIFYFEFAILIINTLCRINEDVKQYNVNTTLNSLLKLLLVVVIYYIVGIHSIIIIPLGLLITEFLQFIYLANKYKLFTILKNNKMDFNILKQLFIYGFPLMGISITSWVLNTSDRFVIAYFFDSSKVGLYSYAYSLANSVFTLLIQFIMLGAYPNIIKEYEMNGKEGSERCITEYLNIYMLVLLPLCIGASLVAKDFFSLFTSANYRESYIVFIITSLSIFVLGLTQYYNKPYEMKKNTKRILLINVIIALVNLILNVIFMKKFGYVFGAWSTLISYIIYIIIACLFNNTNIRIKYDFIVIFKIILSTMFMSIPIFVINHFYENNLVLFIIKIILSGLIYLIFVFGLKIVNFKKILKLNKGEK